MSQYFALFLDDSAHPDELAGIVERVCLWIAAGIEADPAFPNILGHDFQYASHIAADLFRQPGRGFPAIRSETVAAFREDESFHVQLIHGLPQTRGEAGGQRIVADEIGIVGHVERL